jgi:hypothetical protein
MSRGSAGGRKPNKHCKTAGLEPFEFNAGVAESFSIRNIGANTELPCSSPNLSPELPSGHADAPRIKGSDCACGGRPSEIQF